jgi:hypothetical protein
VVDCGGRRSQLGSWLEAAGARRPVEEREDSGFIYYARHFRSRTGELPAVRSNLIQHYDSVTLLTLPADNGTWSVVVTSSSRDRALRGLRDQRRWEAAVARYPLVANWLDGEPITGIDVIAGIEDRHRLAEIDAEIAWTPYATDDRRWHVGKALFAASLVDHDACRAYQSLASFLATPDELFAQPGLLDRVLTLGAGAPRYPLPGPARRELLTAIAN